MGEMDNQLTITNLRSVTSHGHPSSKPQKRHPKVHPPPPIFSWWEIPPRVGVGESAQASALFRDHLLQFFDLRKKVDTHTLNSIILQVQVTPHPIHLQLK